MVLLEDAQQPAQGLDLLVLLPCAIPLAAAAAYFAARGRLRAPLAVGAAWSTFAAAVALLVRVLREGPSSSPAGGWAWPWSGEHQVDAAAGFTLVLVTGIAALALSAASGRPAIGDAPRSWALRLLWLAALERAVVSGHLVNAIVFLELALLAASALRRLEGGHTPRASPALARGHRRLWALSAATLAIGALGTYAATGALDLVEVRVRAADADPPWIQASFWLLAIGACLTVGLTALEAWLARAPDAVRPIALQTAATGKVALFFVLRFSLGTFGEKFTLQKQPIELLVMGLALLLLAGGATLALRQKRLDGLLCSIGVAQTGGLLLGMSLGNIDGLTGSLTGLMSLGLAECALFLAVGAFSERTGSLEIRSLAGIGRSMPLALGAFAVAALGLAGVPPTVGFVSTWYLVLGALQSGLWPLALLFLAIACAALVAFGRVIEVACFEPVERGAVAEAPLSLLVPMWLAALASLALGLATAGSAGVAARAAGALLEVAL